MQRWTDTSAETLDAIARTLARGGVVLLPTDTIYGLHGLAGDDAVAARIAAMKGRDASKAFVVIAASAEQLKAFGALIPEVVTTIWPAPLTAVVPLTRRGTEEPEEPRNQPVTRRGTEEPEEPTNRPSTRRGTEEPEEPRNRPLTRRGTEEPEEPRNRPGGGSATLAVRVPAVDWLRDLLARTGPLVSTSANRSGEPPISAPELLARDLLFALDGLLDLGPRAGEPSSIVDFTGDEPRFIRKGDPRFTQNLRKTLRISL